MPAVLLQQIMLDHDAVDAIWSLVPHVSMSLYLYVSMLKVCLYVSHSIQIEGMNDPNRWNADIS